MPEFTATAATARLNPSANLGDPIARFNGYYSVTAKCGDCPAAGEQLFLIGDDESQEPAPGRGRSVTGKRQVQLRCTNCKQLGTIDEGILRRLLKRDSTEKMRSDFKEPDVS